MKYKAIRGMEDILPGRTPAWQALEKTARKIFESYGYSEIRTPVIEETQVFVRSIGETSDIVAKEMYTFKDRKDRSLTLRPEGTAPVVRSFIEHALDKLSAETKLYYMGPMFRSERPQKGRSRQFHQIGVEVMGTDSPYAEAEVIIQLDRLLRDFGLSGFTLKLNSLGCKKDKEAFKVKLENFLRDKKARLCEDCKIRLKKNVLRVLDCKKDPCRNLTREAPAAPDSLCSDCRERYGKTKEILKAVKVPFVEVKNLVRGLDYYTGTVFEITHDKLGGQDAIAAGGRYDSLVKDMGGRDVPAVGYALGMERVLIALGEKIKPPEKKVVYIVTLGDKAKIEGFRVAETLRKESGISVLTDTKEASLKSQMRTADKAGAEISVIIGENELREKKALVRDMKTAEQREVSLEQVAGEVSRRVNGK